MMDTGRPTRRDDRAGPRPGATDLQERRLASRLRFGNERAERRRPTAGAGRGGADPAASGRPRSLLRLYRELVRLLAGHWATLATALAALSATTALRLV